MVRNPRTRRTSRTLNFGWTTPNAQDLSMDNPENRRIFREIILEQIEYERERIREHYFDSTVFLTRFAGRPHQLYGGRRDWDVVRVEFFNPNNPTIPTLTLVHTPLGEPDNFIVIHLELLNENMLR